MISRGALVILVGLTALGLGSAVVAAPPRVAVDPWLREWRLRLDHASGTPFAPRAGRVPRTVPVFLIGRPDLSALRRLGAEGRAVTPNITTARVPIAALDQLGDVPGLDGVMLAKPVGLCLDAAIDSIHARALRHLEADQRWSGDTGKGVVVGIVDSGVDPTHEDFRFPDGTSRITAYWDQTDTTGSPPDSFGYGSEWVGSALLATSRAWDPVGHGTHVAGIAAGDGSAAQVDSLRFRFVGLAPEADLVAVAVDLSLDTDILDAVRYVFDRAAAAGRPAVVNLSLGSQFGPHDGTTPLETGIDALVGPGKLVVAAAGNEGEDRMHAELHVAPGSRDSASVFVAPYATGGSFLFFSVDAFYADPGAFEVTVVTPGGARFGPYRQGDAASDTLTGQGTLFLDHAPYPANPQKIEVALLISNSDPNPQDGLSVPPPATGEWRIVFSDLNGAAGGGEVDLWLSLSSIRDLGGNEPFWLQGYMPGKEIAAPGSARGVLTAGSFNTKACWPDSLGITQCTSVPVALTPPGLITFFSSRGPTQDGREKPEIVAPGFVVASAKSAQISPEFAALYRFDHTLQPDREHFVFTGTSVSAPHLTGAVALVLEHDPSIDPESMRALLKNTARHDEHAPPGWTAASGYGKLDVAALLQVVPVRPGALRVSTGPTGRPRLEWEGGEEAAFRLESQRNGEGWQERARIPGPGHHVWEESQDASRWEYRLWSIGRAGETEVWAQGAWTRVSELALRNPSPNPFRDACSVTVAGAPENTSAPLVVDVIDAGGRRVQRLEAPPGILTLRWDGRDERGRAVPAGVYWLRVRMGTFMRSARVVRIS